MRMERFTVTRVSNKNLQNDDNRKGNAEVSLNVNELIARKNSQTVPVGFHDRRKFSWAQLTR